MKKQKRIKGAILEIYSEPFYYYAQILVTGLAFFDHRSQTPLEELDTLNQKKALFIIEVYDSAITKGKWKIVGNLPIRKDLQSQPLKFIQDKLNPDFFELYNPITGEITPASREECLGLEKAAVWDAQHVEERLNDYYNGIENVWVKALSIK